MQQDQLTLAVALEDDATFQNFYAGPNQTVIQYLRQWVSGDVQEFCCYLFGVSGVGRTHLLQACCHEFQLKALRAAYLPLAKVDSISPVMLENLEQFDCVCVDDIDVVMGNTDWEEALFHFYNAARDAGARLLVSASQPPAGISCQLSDLRSRLAWGMCWELNALDDEQKLHVLQLRAERRGFTLSSEVGRYLMRHYPRNMRALFDVLEQIDTASLVAKRRVTIPFIKTLLEPADNAAVACDSVTVSKGETRC